MTAETHKLISIPAACSTSDTCRAVLDYLAACGFAISYQPRICISCGARTDSSGNLPCDH